MMAEKVKKTPTTEQKTKRKKVLWATFWTTAISAVVAAGIAIPLVRASKALPAPTEILDSNSPILNIETPNGKVTPKYGEIDKKPSEPNKNKNISDSMEKFTAKYLYEQEYEASLWYQAVYNANKARLDEKVFALDSVEKIREKVKKELEDLKKQFQKQYGLEKKWEEKFKERLNSEEWGKSKNESEAIEHKLNLEIKKHAFRRFETEVNNDWTYKDLKDGIIANKDVFYEYKGKRVNIAKKGESIILPFAKENENYVLPANDSEEVNKDSKTSIKIPMFVTKSFVKEYKNANRFIAPWISKGQGILSEFSLSAHQDQKGSEKPWIVTKTEIINLLKFAAYDESDTTVKIKLGIDGLGEFKGFSTLIKSGNITSADEKQATNDKKLIKALSADKTNADKFGSKGFINLKQTISTSEPSVYLNMLSMISGDGEANKGVFKYKQKDDLFKKLKTELLKEFFLIEDFVNLESTYKAKLKGALEQEPKAENKSTEYDKEYGKHNSEIERIINDLDDKKFAKAFGNAFKTVFTSGNEKNKVDAIYKVGENFVTLNEKGILIQNLHKFDKEEEIKQLIVKDLTIKSKANYSPTFTTELFDLTKIFSDILNTSFQLNELLSQEKFKNYIKEQEYTPIDSDKAKKFNDDDIKAAQDYIKTIEISNQSTSIANKYKQIDDYIKNQINLGLVLDYKYDQTKNKYTISPHNIEANITDYLFNLIVKYVLGN
ncbi:hypothetical protein OF364_01530 [Mycoplasma enhydrae]|uniref:HinT-interacting membrane complex protein P80 n=1 Tax=Mycoplasma enhydrae TaxID=2499220 RepID=UPI0021E8A60C|nr:hypothetical protein [Mycoplasma enhydrae]MCV3753493.1 hypothetical protein [Mycoplasma enhydrae]